MTDSSSQLISQTDPAQVIADSILDKPAILFAGQGSQEKGMGKDIAESDTGAMQLWEFAEKTSGLPLREIYWDGDDAEMNDTRALQPALTVVNISLWQNLKKQHDINPFGFAGHSLGEFSALACSGVITPQEAIEITTLRGKLMADADPDNKTGMAAIVKLEESQVHQIVNDAANESGELIVAANYNTPTQIVVSGGKNAVEMACAKAKKLKGRSVPLKVSGAFHSPLMTAANNKFQSVLEKITWRDPIAPIYSNVDAKPAYKGHEVKKNILRQMISPVFWVNLIRNIYLAGVRWWMEISPRAVLGKMVGPSMAGIAGYCDNLRIDLINSLSSVLNYTF